jgi:hypothetical protein
VARTAHSPSSSGGTSHSSRPLCPWIDPLIDASPVARFLLTSNRGLLAPWELHAADEFWT